MKNFEENYLTGVRKQFEYYKLIGERMFQQLNDEALFWQYNETSNSIAVMVNHLWGNMLSRWTDFITTDGEKEWRDRELEFEDVVKTRDQMLRKWNEGWTCLFDALDHLNEKNFNSQIYIRNQAHSIPDAINRQLAHYAYHIGQVVYVGRMLKNLEWRSLSIPKGESVNFNADKFSIPKHKAHFTDEFLDDKVLLKA